MVLKEGDPVKWMLPLDSDYSFGRILTINKSKASVIHTKGYHTGAREEVHIRYIKRRGKRGGKSKRRRK